MQDSWKWGAGQNGRGTRTGSEHAQWSSGGAVPPKECEDCRAETRQDVS